MFKGKRIALVHDWLIGMGGAEQVLLCLHELFPEAPIYTTIYDPEALPSAFSALDIRPSFLQGWPGSRKHYQKLLPFMPLAFERFDFTKYDWVISSSHACAKGILTGPLTHHIAYIHTPMRYAWDMYHAYIDAAQTPLWKRAVYQPLLHYLRLWDVASASRPDTLLCNSQFVQKRIKKYWSRDARVLYPPVNLPESPPPAIAREDFYLWAGRLVPYKRGDIAVAAFAQNGRTLVVAGEGPERARLQARAPKNIRFLGRVSDAELKALYHKARGLIYPGIEDFGIMPVEAMAHGCPVLAYGKGGATETVLPRETGLWFSEATSESLNQALADFEAVSWSHDVLIRQASNFGKARFLKEMRCIFQGLIHQQELKTGA